MHIDRGGLNAHWAGFSPVGWGGWAGFGPVGWIEDFSGELQLDPTIKAVLLTYDIMTTSGRECTPS